MSPSTSIGIVVASDINSKTSNICVHDASLLSLTPSAVDIDSPDAHIPLKPLTSTIFAVKPLCASIKNDNSLLLSSFFNSCDLDNLLIPTSFVRIIVIGYNCIINIKILQMCEIKIIYNF